MRSRAVTVFSLLLTAALLLGITGTAIAEVGDDPFVTPITGDKEFTTEVLPIVQFPGTTEVNQKLLPVGFPAGEAQFEGSGVVVKGMENGKATVCFTISSVKVNQGWGGKIGRWDGSKWVLLSTTITTPDEAIASYACTTITGDGTYAFISWVVDSSKLSTMQECPFEFGIDSFWITGVWADSGTGYTDSVTGMEFYATQDISGMPITVQYLYSIPGTDSEGVPSFSWGGTASGTASLDYGSYYEMDVDPYIDYFRTYESHLEYYRVTIGSCYVIAERDFTRQ